MTVELVARSGHSLRAADAAWRTRAIHSRCEAHATRPRAHRRGLSATHTCACSLRRQILPHRLQRTTGPPARGFPRASECVHACWATRDAARTPWDRSLGARQRRRERLFEVRDTHAPSRSDVAMQRLAVSVRNSSKLRQTCHKLVCACIKCVRNSL